MASTLHFVPVSEYLKSEYEPDAEYVDGEIEERAVPEYGHAAWQAAIHGWFQGHAVEWGIRVKGELRIQVAATRFRVPDVTVIERALPKEQIITVAPVAVFEVISPEDTVRRLMRKLGDYASMGIPEIWVVDPETRLFSRFEDGQLLRRTEFSHADKGISFHLNQIESLLD